MVHALRTATGMDPRVAGKPAPALMTEAVARGVLRAALVVGDRLDTDYRGANAAGLPSLMVLIGVNSAWDAVYAGTQCRPTYWPRPALAIISEQRKYSEPLAVVNAAGLADRRRCGGCAVTALRGTATSTIWNLSTTGYFIVWAVASAVWEARAADSPAGHLRASRPATSGPRGLCNAGR